MTLTRRHALTLAASYAATAALPARAQQNWPQRSLRILIGTTPGGSPDIIGRMLADKMTGPLGQSITVENNTGGGGGIAAGIVSNAPPDGYAMTLLTAGYASGAAVGKFQFDGDNTFAFITMVCSYPFVYMVPKDSPIKSFPDMLARAKANPGKLSYVITSLGAVYHLIGTWVGMKAGIDDGADLLSRLVRGRHRRAHRARRRDAGARDLRVPARPHRPVPRAGGDLAAALCADAGGADRGRDAAGRALHVVARHGDLPAHAATDRRSAERGNPSRADAARRQAEAQGRRQHRDARPRPKGCASRSTDEIANWKAIVEANNIKVN